MRRSCSTIATLISLAALTAACASDHTAGSTSSQLPTTEKLIIAAPVSQAPSQDPNGGKLVKYDPCMNIGDDMVTKTGFDPRTRKRSDQVHTGYAFISCRFDRKELVDGQNLSVGYLEISSTNITMDQFRKRAGAAASDILIDGKSAITYADPASESCNVVTTGPDNSIDIMVNTVGALTNWNGCSHLQEIASIVNSEIPAS